MSTQREKADALRALHHGEDTLLLPNIWDVAGALLLEDLGFPAVATASAAVATSFGVPDGEHLSFDTMLDVIRRIASAVRVPMTADIEGGYASTLDDLRGNVSRVIEAGAVGINIEDSVGEGEHMREIGEQCDRVRACRAAADDAGIPLVINARIDVFMPDTSRSLAQTTELAVARARAYLEAGADCVYPIGAGDRTSLETIVRETRAPVNAYLSPVSIPLSEMRTAGVRRVSIGPNLMRAGLGAMRRAATALRDTGSSDALFKGALTRAEAERFIEKGRR